MAEDIPPDVDLADTVAVVTGASRGAGRGIALELGSAGATVYVTGRSVDGDSTRDDLPGTTIDQTAELVTERGGIGVAARCDHTVDEQVEALFEQVKAEHDRLDVLVNNAWGGYERYGDFDFDAPFWEQPLWRWDGMFRAGAQSHYTSSRFAVPLMLAQERGLIANTTFWDRDKYLSNLPYDLAKTTINRMTYGMALELDAHGIAAVALSPGFMRTESILDAHGVDEQTWQADPSLERTESPRYVGRAVTALAADADVMEKSGSVLKVGALAEEYGFTDIDGRQPPPYRMSDNSLRD